jgi:hypothetical protein
MSIVENFKKESLDQQITKEEIKPHQPLFNKLPMTTFGTIDETTFATINS